LLFCREVAARFSKLLCRPSGEEEETEVVAFEEAWLRVGKGSLAGEGGRGAFWIPFMLW
jgi:hypothetical protein